MSLAVRLLPLRGDGLVTSLREGEQALVCLRLVGCRLVGKRARPRRSAKPFASRRSRLSRRTATSRRAFSSNVVPRTKRWGSIISSRAVNDSV